MKTEIRRGLFCSSESEIFQLLWWSMEGSTFGNKDLTQLLIAVNISEEKIPKSIGLTSTLDLVIF